MGKLLFALFLIYLPIAACHMPTTKNYEWLGSVCAPTDAPAKLIEGSFTLSDGQVVPLQAGHITANGWGKVGNLYLLNDDDPKALPVTFTAQWYSYLQSKFYTATASFPAAELDTLFNKGLPNPYAAADDEILVPESIVLGLGPFGYWAVWASANGITHLIMQGQGTETELPWYSVTENTELSRPAFTEYLLKEAYGADSAGRLLRTAMRSTLYPAYHKTWPLHFKCISLRPIHHVWMHGFNGEVKKGAVPANVPFTLLNTLPSIIKITWQATSGAWYEGTLQFEFAELEQAARLCAGANTDILCTIQISEEGPTLTAYMAAGSMVVPLKQLQATVYKL